MRVGSTGNEHVQKRSRNTIESHDAIAEVATHVEMSIWTKYEVGRRKQTSAGRKDIDERAAHAAVAKYFAAGRAADIKVPIWTKSDPVCAVEAPTTRCNEDVNKRSCRA